MTVPPLGGPGGGYSLSGWRRLRGSLRAVAEQLMRDSLRSDYRLGQLLGYLRIRMDREHVQNYEQARVYWCLRDRVIAELVRRGFISFAD